MPDALNSEHKNNLSEKEHQKCLQENEQYEERQRKNLINSGFSHNFI